MSVEEFARVVCDGCRRCAPRSPRGRAREAATAAGFAMIDGRDLCATCKECEACARAMPRDCSKSQRPCGHHCECSWTHDVCHYCGEEFGEEPSEPSSGSEKR